MSHNKQSIAICNKLIELNSCEIYCKKDKSLEYLCSKLADAIQNTNLETKLREIEQIEIKKV